MKLEQSGLKEYNLKGIDITSGKHRYAAAVTYSPGQRKGDILKQLEKDNVFYYSKQPLSLMPPAYSSLLALSHKIFNPGKFYSYIDKNLGIKALSLNPGIFFQSQFYAVIINFIFSLMFITLVFFLGKSLFNREVGLLSAFFIAVNGLDMVTSQKIWADEMVSFFTALCLLLFWEGRKRKKTLLIFLSGVSAGIASLTKGSGLFVIPVVICFCLLSACLKAPERKNFFKALYGKQIIIFILTSAAVVMLWYAKVTLVYGIPWYMSHQQGIEEVSPWFMMLARRSRLGVLYYPLCLCPLFILFYFETLRTFLRKIFTPERIFLLVWFFSFAAFLIVLKGKEARYMLPAYPPLALLSSAALIDIRKRLNMFTNTRYPGTILITCAFGANAIWSVLLGLSCVFSNCVAFNF